MNIKRISSLVFALIFCIFIISLVSCTKPQTDSSDVGTYYYYGDDGTDKSQYVKLNKDMTWSDSDGITGRYEVNNGVISFYVSEAGEELLYVSGNLSNGKLTISLSSYDVTVTYYLDGKAPSGNSADAGNGGDNNEDQGGDDNTDDTPTPEELLADFIYTFENERYVITGVQNPKVTELVIPDIVDEITEQAFKECTKLKSISLPFVGLTRDEEAPNLAKIFKYQKLSGIHTGADGYYTAPLSLETVIIRGDAPADAIYSGADVKEIVFLGSVAGFSERAFSNFSNLESIKIADGLEIVDFALFANCPMLKEIKLPETVKEIRYAAFASCPNLEEIYIPASVTKLDNAFDIGEITVIFGGSEEQFNAIEFVDDWYNQDELNVTFNG